MRKPSIRNPRRLRINYVPAWARREYPVKATFAGEQAQFLKWCHKLDKEMI